MKLLGANPAARITGLDELPGKINYYLGNDSSKWRTGVPTYGRVRYQNVYPGIDLEFYGNQRQLEYDFIVAPGANPQAVRLAFEGPEKMALDDEGNLVLHFPDGEIVQRAPVIYQMAGDTRRQVVGRFVRAENNEIRFLVGDYDSSLPLVIDPMVLSYSTYLGGSGSDSGYGIAVDSSGNAYVTGYTESSDMPTHNALQGSSGGGRDDFVAKLTSAGALVYSTYLGGSGDDYGAGIAADSSGNAYVTGYTKLDNFPTTGGTLEPTSSGRYCHIYTPGYTHCYDSFVTKINSDGSAKVYSTYLGSIDHGDDLAWEVAVDSSGNAYVSGRTQADDFPVTAGVVQGTIGAGICETTSFTTVHCYDAFVAKLNSDATALTYATYLGGTGSEYGQSLALGSGGVVYVAGYTNSTNFPATGGAFQTSHGGGTYDAFLAKLSADATSLGYATYLGGSGDDFGYNVRVNTGGEAFVTGYTHSTNFPTANAFQPSNGGGGNPDIFVSTMNSSGSDLLYSSYLGTSTGEFGYGIALDSSGNAYITGRAESSSFPTSPGAYQTTYGGSGDAVVVKIIASSDNPVPEIASLSPDSGPRGGPDFALTVNGSPFVSNSVVRWNGSDRTTTFINNFKLQATIPASDISAPGTAEVTVFTPTPGGGLSSGITFTILSPEVGLSPRAMDFDPRVISSTSDAQPITLTNTGSAPLTINSIDISGSEAADFGKSHNCPISPSTLAAGDPCTINITFTPAAIGPRKAVLLFSSDAPGSPHRAMLTGLGSAVDLSPGSWDFGSQTVNISSAAKAFTLSNLGGTPIHVWKAAMSGVNAVDFHQTNDCPTPPSTLAGGASCTFNVTFQPTALGARAATLGISHDGGGSPSSVSLTGTGASALQTQAADSPVLVVPMILPGTAQIPEDTDSSADGKRKAKAKTTKERTERQ